MLLSSTVLYTKKKNGDRLQLPLEPRQVAHPMTAPRGEMHVMEGIWPWLQEPSPLVRSGVQGGEQAQI